MRTKEVEAVIEAYIRKRCFRNKNTIMKVKTDLRPFFMFGIPDKNPATYIRKDYEALEKKEQIQIRNEYQDDILKYNSYLLDHYTSGLTIKGFLSDLKKFFQTYDIEFKGMFWSDIRNVGIGTCRTTEERTPTVEELRTILRWAQPDIKALALVIATSGCRENDALALTIDDVVMGKNSAKLTIRHPKNKNSGSNGIHYTFCSKEAVEALKDWYLTEKKYDTDEMDKDGKPITITTTSREQYLKEKQRKCIGREFKTKVSLTDRRIFPYVDTTASEKWNNCLERSGLNQKSTVGKKIRYDTKKDGTQYKEVHTYLLRFYSLKSFFRVQLSKYNRDLAEFCIGHFNMGNHYYAKGIPEADVWKEYDELQKHLWVDKEYVDTGEIEGLQKALAQKDKEILEIKTDFEQQKQSMESNIEAFLKSPLAKKIIKEQMKEAEQTLNGIVL